MNIVERFGGEPSPQISESARRLAQRLLRPGLLDVGFRSGLFVSGPLSTTTFLLNELIPALESEGAAVIHVDLRHGMQSDPSVPVRAAIAAKLNQLGIFSPVDPNTTLATALRFIVDLAKVDAVLILDGVQQAALFDREDSLMRGLKSARDTINLRPGTSGHFILIGADSNRGQVKELVTGYNQAFLGANFVESLERECPPIDGLRNEQPKI